MSQNALESIEQAIETLQWNRRQYELNASAGSPQQINETAPHQQGIAHYQRAIARLEGLRQTLLQQNESTSTTGSTLVNEASPGSRDSSIPSTVPITIGMPPPPMVEEYGQLLSQRPTNGIEQVPEANQPPLGQQSKTPTLQPSNSPQNGHDLNAEVPQRPKVLPQQHLLLCSEIINEEKINAETITAQILNVEKINAKLVEASTINTKTVNAETIFVRTINATTINADSLNAVTVNAESINVETVNAYVINTKKISAKLIETRTISADEIKAETVDADQVRLSQ